MRFALNVNEEQMILVNFTNSPSERNGLNVNYYGNYVTTTYLLRGRRTLYYASLYPPQRKKGISASERISVLNNLL